MIFPTEALQALRRSLAEKLEAGTVAEGEAFRQALEADPDDSTAFLHLFELAMTARRFSEAERLGWELVRTAPTASRSYLMLTTALEKRHARSNLAMECMLLGLEMLGFEEDELDEFDFAELLADDMLGLIQGLSKRNALRVVLNGLRQIQDTRGALSAELAPYRHILALRAGPIERAEVDAIVADSRACAPALRGVLKQFAEGILAADVPLVERALVLLGEIGDPAYIWDIVGFLTDEELSEPAMWAFCRVSSRRPGESFDEIRRVLSGSGEPLQLFLAARLAVYLPDLPGRVEFLSALIDEIQDLPRSERSQIFALALSGVYVIDGPDSPAAAAIELRYERMLTKKIRKQVQKIRDLRRQNGPEPPPSFETDVYDICCTGPNLTELNEDGLPI